MAARAALDRPDHPARDEPRSRQQDNESGSWHQRVDAIVAYSPHGAGTLSGFAGLLLAPNKVVGVGVLLIGQIVDVGKTYWERKAQRRKETDDAN